MRLLLRLLPLLLLVFPAATAVAKDKPVVETRTYLVQVILSGTYQQTDVTGEADGYCNGTGEAITANFHLVSTAKLRVKLDTTKAATAVPVVDTTGDWQAENAFIHDGDTCDMIEKSQCSGVVAEDRGTGIPDHAYAQGSGHYVAFGTDLQGPPDLKSVPSDCHGNEMISPPTNFGVLPLSAYTLASTSIKLVKLNELKKGKKRTRTYKPPKGTVGADVDIPTCNHTPGCTASLTNFVHTISIKRVK